MSDLTRLNPTPHAIAVYASQPLSPVATQHSLPSRTLPFTWAGLSPAGSHQLCLAHSFNHVIGERQQLVGNFEAEHLRGTEVDHQLEFGRQDNRQITRLLAFEDASGINTGLTICIGNAGPVAHQSAGSDVLAQDIDRGNSMSGRQRDNPFPLRGQERADADVQRGSPTLYERCKGGLDLAVAAGVEDFDLLPYGRS